MKNKAIKSILAIIILSVSPFIMLGVIGILYVIPQMIGGASFEVGVKSFINFIYSLTPFFSYLTTIPIIIFLATLLGKSKHKILKLLSKR